MSNNQSRPMTFNRDDIEHSYFIVSRLRARLQSLADLAIPQKQLKRAERVAQEAVQLLQARACIFQYFNGTSLKTITAHHDETLSLSRLEALATHVGEDVVRKKVVVNTDNLVAQYPNTRLLAGTVISSYLGVPLLNSNGNVMGVATVIDGNAREFDKDDERWFVTVAQSVADAIMFEDLELKLNTLESTLRPPVSLAEPEKEKDDSKRPSILVIDDDRALNDLLCEFLSEEGYKVEAAFDGLEGMRIFQPSEHNVVMTDVAMPHMNGWELIAALRVRAPELPIILITGYSSAHWNEQYLRKQGVIAVLNKPLDLNYLSVILKDITLMANSSATI
jgi:CheY-like chemotaxis protein